MRPWSMSCLMNRSLNLLAVLATLGLVGCYSAGGSGVSGQSSLAPQIVTQPQSQTVALAGTATFQVTGSGTPLPSYQWERSNDTGTSWTPIPGATGTSYALANASTADNQAQFHVVLADPAGTVTSAGATLSVSASVGDCQQVASLPPQSVPTGICTGPDGNLWFTNSGKGQIGKMDAISHQVSLVNLPNPACKPVGITAGPDGNLWFTEQVDGKIGVLTTGGALNNEFPVGQGPTAIVTGSDGNLWTTLQTSNQIARMTTSGSVNVYAVPTANASPSGITLAPDGSVWFSEQAAAQIARISPAGVVTEYGLQIPSGGVTPVPVAVTATPDGNIYYSDQANNCIGRFSPAAQAAAAARARGLLVPDFLADTVGLTVTVFFPLSAGANPNGLTVDIQGQVWITEQGTGQLAEITLTTAPGTPPVSFDLPTATGTPANVTQGADGNFYITEPGGDDVVMVVGIAPTSSVSVTVLPASATVVGNGTQNFQAIVLGTPTNTVTWSVLEGAAGGTITPDTGVYLAPDTAGTYHVVATSNAVTPAVTGTAAVTVTVPAISAITPANPTVQAGAQAIFSAQVTGLSDDSVVWSASDGAMNPTTGVWTVPNKAETVTITATSNLDSSLFTTTLAVIPPSGSALPIITTMPANVSVASGGTATFTVVVTGVTTAVYQWQVSTNGGTSWTNVATGTGAATASYTTAAVAAANDGSLYQVVIGNGAGGSVTSNAARLTVPYAPVIVTQPLNQAVLVGATATFNVSATGDPAPAYQWEVSTNGGTSYTSISGATSASYTTPATTAGFDGNLYEVVITNGVGAGATSTAATLTLTATPLGITGAPASQTVTAGSTATFTVVAFGTPAPTYQWQWSSDGGSTWSNVGGNTATYSTGPATAGMDGNLVQVQVSNGTATVTSPVARLTVQYAPSISVALVNQAVTAPAAASFAVTATADPAPGYQWAVSTDGGGTWTNIGANAPTFNTGATTAGSYLYRVTVTSGTAPSASSTATLTVDGIPANGPAVIINGGSAYVTANLGTTATVAAQPAGSTYAWAISGGTFSGGGSSASTAVNSVTIIPGASGTVSVNCTIGNPLGVAGTPGSATVSTIVAAPANGPAVAVNGTASFVTANATCTATVAAQPAGSTYTWSLAGGTLLGSNPSTVPSIAFTAGATGSVSLTCTITNAAGLAGSAGSATNCGIVAMPANAPAISVTGNGSYLTANASATASVTAPGSSFAWTISGGTFAGSASTATTASNSIAFTSGGSGSLSLTCAISNAAGLAGTAGVSSTLSIVPAPTNAPAVAVNVSASAVTMGSSNTASVSTSDPAGSTYNWTISGGTFAGSVTTAATASNSIAFTAGASGSVSLTCAITNAAGLGGSAGTATVCPIVAPPGTPTVTINGSASYSAPYVSPNASCTAAVAQPGSSYFWTISGGSFTSSNPSSTPSITFNASGSGTVRLTCTISNAAGLAGTTSSATTAEILTITNLDQQVAPGMGSTYGTSAPSLPADTVASWYYYSSSNGTSLLSASVLGTSISTATVSSLVLQNLPATAGSFYVYLMLTGTDGGGWTATSNWASLTVVSPYGGSMMAAGDHHSLVISGGNVLACGANGEGQLGIGSRLNSGTFGYVQSNATPSGPQAPVLGATQGVASVAADGSHNLALDQVGEIWFWGDSSTLVATPVLFDGYPSGPASMSYLVGTMVAANATAGFALLTAPETTTPWLVQGLGGTSLSWDMDYPAAAIDAVDADYHGLPVVAVLDTHGNVFAREAPYTTGSWSTMTLPEPGPTYQSPFVAIFGGKGTDLYALDSAGNLWQWPGVNPASPTNILLPATNPDTDGPSTGKCVAFAQGDGFCLALTSDGLLWSAGANESGQLGQGSMTPSQPAYQLVASSNNGQDAGSYNYQTVAAGPAFAMAMDGLGNGLGSEWVTPSLWTWGAYGVGELGNLNQAVIAPYQFVSGSWPAGPVILAPGIGISYEYGVSLSLSTLIGSRGDVLVPDYAPDTGAPPFAIWGWDTGLYLGAAEVPGTWTTGAMPALGGNGLLVAASGILANHALAVDATNSLWSWGLNTSGQLGLGNQSPVGGSLTALATNFPSAIASQGTALGNYIVSPVAAGPAHSLALDSSGNLYAWGSNAAGQLGTAPSSSPSLTPQAVNIDPVSSNPFASYYNGASDTLTDVAAGADFSVAISSYVNQYSYGQVYTMGSNQHGQLGMGDFGAYTGLQWVNMDLFFAVPIDMVSAGAEHVLALDDYNNVWAWGGNEHGQVGQGNFTDESIPTLILGTAASVSALNGSLVDGFYGNPITAVTTCPYPIVQVCAGPYFSLALDANGGIWVWGDNAKGALGLVLGDGTPVSGVYPTPQYLTLFPYGTIQGLVATANSVVAVDHGQYLYTWGLNHRGMLGLGTTYSSAYPATVQPAMPSYATSIVTEPNTPFNTPGAGGYDWSTWYTDYGGGSGD